MSPKRRTSNSHLPERVYLKHGAFYYVDRNNKWHHLGREFPGAMAEWVRLVDLPTEIHTMSALINRYMLEIAPKKSQKSYKCNLTEIIPLRSAFGHMSPASVTPVHIYQYLDIRGKTAPVSANREKSLLSHIFTTAIRWGVVTTNPCNNVRRLKESRRDRYVSDEEFAAIRQIAPPMIQNIMDFAYLTGLRQSDILAIKMSAVTDDGIFVAVSKTKNKLLFEWSDALRVVVNNAIAMHKPNSDALFVSGKGTAYEPSGFRTIWQRLMVTAFDAGLIKERFRFHDIRRKSATDIENSSSRESARKLLGHSDQKTTGIYISGVQKVKPIR